MTAPTATIANQREREAAATYEVVKDRNAGNSANTYYKASGERQYCIRLTTGDYLRDSAGRVRRFRKHGAAVAAAEASHEVQTLKSKASGEPDGFTCECGEFHRFIAYVLAHWSEPLDHSCDKCGRKHSVRRGFATLKPADTSTGVSK